MNMESAGRGLMRAIAQINRLFHYLFPLKLLVKGNNGRYAAVNLMNYATIEFRMFRGTLKLNTFLATLELVNAIIDTAIYYSEEGLHKLSWSEFVSNIKEPELIQYLKERRLYINESIESEEEL